MESITPESTQDIAQDTGDRALTPMDTPQDTEERALTPMEIPQETGERDVTPKDTPQDTGDGVLTHKDTSHDSGDGGLTPLEIPQEIGERDVTPKDTPQDTGDGVLSSAKITQPAREGVVPPPDRRTPPHFVLAYFLLPFLFVGVYVWILYILLPYEQFLLMTGLMLAYLIPPAGKETVIPLGIALGLPWYLVATSVAMVDVGTGLFMAWNFDLALKIPVLGPWIGRFMFHGQEFVRQRPWLERLYFVGLALFVMFPLQGSGGVGASIVGRILGMSKGEVVAAIAIGAFAGSFLLALGIEFLKDILLANLAAGIAVILTVVVVVVIIFLYSRERKKSQEKKE